MTLKFYTFTAKHSGKVHCATGHNCREARAKTGLPSKDLDLVKIETLPVQQRFTDHGFQPFKPLADRTRSSTEQKIE
ncbi:hypothetical protein ES703_53684 [subsurface metagenome]